MKSIPNNKTIIVAFSGGESSAYMLKLILDKYQFTHKIIVCFCNTGEEDEETLIFTKKISEYFNIHIVWLEYAPKKDRMDRYGAEIIGSQGDFKIVDFNSAYRINDFEEENEYPNHPFLAYVNDYGLPQYPNRTCTREMKERTISRYLSSIGIMPRMCVRCVGIRFDEISSRTPDEKQYYELIIQGVTKPIINRFFQYEMPFRLNIPSYMGNCGACISKALRNLCTIAREKPRKFKFFDFLSKRFGDDKHTFYRNHNTVESIFEMAKDDTIKNARDNRFDLEYQTDLFFDTELDSEGACGGTCEAFS
jgi:hypothetical protein